MFIALLSPCVTSDGHRGHDRYKKIDEQRLPAND